MQRGRTALITSVAHITVPQSSVSRTMVHQPYRAAQTGRTLPLSSTPHHFPGLSNLVLMTDSYVPTSVVIRTHPHTHARTHTCFTFLLSVNTFPSFIFMYMHGMAVDTALFSVRSADRHSGIPCKSHSSCPFPWLFLLLFRVVGSVGEYQDERRAALRMMRMRGGLCI
jgi:hypothetical protein